MVCLVSIVLAITLLTHPTDNQVLFLAQVKSVVQPKTNDGVATAAPRTVAPSVNASSALVRINQSSLSQYANRGERDSWWMSTCSAAAMTMVINAYGDRQYRITDILNVESRIGAISAQLGLLYQSGIDDTARHFGFLTTTLRDPTISQVIEMAKKGHPVIVNFPLHARTAQAPEWTTGHYLVVIGGTDKEVRLADSSTVNGGAGLKIVSYGYFATYWHGSAKVLTPQVNQTTVTGKPTLSVDFINRVLAAYHSPAAGKGQALYDLGVKYGIDPTFALAFFLHESTMGTQGEARVTCVPWQLALLRGCYLH